MREVVAIFWKDVRGLRWELAGWLTLIVAFTATWPALATAAAGQGIQYWLFPGISTAPMLLVLAGAILAVRMVQADPLDSTTAGWRTRPLPRGSWLTAKLALAGAAVVVVPSLADAVLALALGMTAGDAARVFAIAAVSWIAWTAPALAIGAVTPSFTRAMLTIVGAIATIALLEPLSPALARVALPFGDASPIAQSRGLVSALILVAGSLVVVVLQARTFRTARSRIVAAVVLFATLVVANAWRWDTWGAVAGRDDREVDPAVIDTDRVTVGLEPGSGREQSRYPYRGSPDVITKASEVLAVRGLPDGVWAEPSDVRSSFQSASGDVLEFDGWPAATAAGSMDVARRHLAGPKLTSVRLALGGDSLPGGLRTPSLWTVSGAILIQAREQTIARLATAPGRLTATVRLRALRYRVASRAPARLGARLRTDQMSVQLVGIEHSVEGYVSLRFRSAVCGRPPSSRSLLVLRDAPRGQALVVSLSPWSGVWLRFFWPVIEVFQVGAYTAHYPSEQSSRPDDRRDDVLPGVLVDASWLADPELVLLEPEYLGSVTKQLVVENYRLPRARGEVR